MSTAERIAETGVYASPCPKCGSTTIRTVYHKQGCDDPHCSCSDCTWGSHTKRHTEHLHRVCLGCFYDWADDVVAASAAPEEDRE